ncbi:hypothetical protein JAAARDRAFT_97396, partial [Jaapia argillacea MUCL 33604]
SLTPQEVRDKLMNDNDKFQKAMIDYLESSHMGEFMDTTMEEIASNTKLTKLDQIDDHKSQSTDEVKKSNIPSDIYALPIKPPDECKKKQCVGCIKCKQIENWMKSFKETVNRLVYNLNRHTCQIGRCKEAKSDATCKARFPRDVQEHTTVDKESGYISMKKLEHYINFFTPILTFLMRCNSDVTCLLTGTAMKAVIVYVTDYVTKSSLKTHVMFDVVRNIVERKSEFLNETTDSIERGRRLLTKITNAFTVKLEIGAPMAALFLLGHNDHYTNCTFKTFYWKSFVKEALKVWYSMTPSSEHNNNEENMQNILEKERIVIHRANEEYIGISPVMDYIFQPLIYETCSLYDWIRLYKKEKMSKSLQKEEHQQGDEMEIEENLIEDEEETQSEHHQKGNSNVPPRFLSDHPQHNSHFAILRQDHESFIPNFVGGSLPRSDKGSREFYCSVMLTLFKPWRTGHDLKLETQDWKSVFDEYEFTDRHRELMKYFNVRYECNDARDDFSAQRKINGIPSSFFNESDSTNELNFDTEIQTYADLFTTNDDGELSQECYGKYAWSKVQDMNQIQNTLELSGW